MSKPLNILYLHSHDAGRFIEPYGMPVRTPHLMRLAKEGVLFRKAFAIAPTCTPSRSAMLTGQYPHECGMFGLTGQGWRIDDYSKHLVNVLHAGGYETVLAGCQHETGDGQLGDLGYERILDEAHPGQFYPETILKVEEYLAEVSRREASRPFFLSVGTDEPHRNNLGRPALGIGNESARFSKTRYYDPDKLDWRYTPPLPNLPDLPEIRKDVASLAEGSRLMDEYFGRVLDALEHYGLAENTLVIATSDHGIEFPGGKKTLGDWGTGVLLIMRGPGGFSGGRVIEPLVSQLDLYPTLLDLLGWEQQPWLRGQSLLPLIRGEAETLHNYVFTEQTYHGRLEPLRAARSERYKLLRRHFADGPQMRQDGPSTPVMEAAGWYDRDLGQESFFDLYLDPQESCNRIDDPALADVVAEHRAALDDWMQDTGDCFPDGSFPAPPDQR